MFEQPHIDLPSPHELALCLQLAKDQLYDEGQAVCNPIFSRRISKEREGIA